ncbi:MAG TPA: GGDEF domain-containing protein [Gemmatimonadaceae bacterium]|nr:GGDEF domain-containing protein [Gemmatimonadaceae bacterium]
MSAPCAALIVSPARETPALLRAWLAARGIPSMVLADPAEVLGRALRSRPRLVVLDGRCAFGTVAPACAALKADSYTGIVPVVVVVPEGEAHLTAAFAAQADEVIREGQPASEVFARLDALLLRSDRDTSVHPSTRLPGTVGIEAELARRLGDGSTFAACYADLDHFKEFNDRYGYHSGDRVIRILAMILHDVVKGACGADGFVGHIGGDDFLFVIPADAVHEICREIVSIFDALIPQQYSDADRRAGYFFGKDRRGHLHRVPLMTVSIGVATNQRRHFSHAAQVSELATEMKTYAKSLPGSVYAIDRRVDELAPAVGSATAREATAGSGR